MDWLIANLEQFTYIGVAVTLFVAGLGVPIPEDIPLIFGGAMAAWGKLNVYAHFGISLAFILIGDACLFFIGRRIGTATSGMGRWSRILTPERREKVIGHFERHGAWTVFFGRFVAGIRGAVFLTAGAARFPFWRFLLLDALAALISVPVWIWLGYHLGRLVGENWDDVLQKAKGYQDGVLIGVVVLVTGFVAYLWIRRRRRRARASAEEQARRQEVEKQQRELPDERLADGEPVGRSQTAQDEQELEQHDQQLPR